MKKLRLSPQSLLVLLCLLALAWIAYDAFRMEQQRRNFANTRAADAVTQPLVQPWRQLSQAAYDVIVTRSLFTPDRASDFESVGQSEPTVRGMVLRGVVVSPNQTLALFEPVGGGPVMRLARGDEFAGVRILEIDAAGVTFDTGQGPQRLALSNVTGTTAD